MPDTISPVRNMRWLWNILSLRSRFGYISMLQRGQKWDPAEFHLTGIRFVDRMVERFGDYGAIEPSQADVLEIGCGIGRFLKPLACHFRHVCGIDISRIMLLRARLYCAGLPNVTLQLGDGSSLAPLKDDSFDYCVCAGVFQHITDVEVVLSYIREALRVLKPGGLFLFQFEGSKTETVGAGRRGAKITARHLTEGLPECPFAIRELSVDSKDAIRNMVVVIEKLRQGENRGGDSRSFQTFKMIDRRWISGVYDDIRTQTSMHARQKQAPMRLTFYDE